MVRSILCLWKTKLTGREVSTYFRRNLSETFRLKAVEVALDLQGAMTVASKEIKKVLW